MEEELEVENKAKRPVMMITASIMVHKRTPLLARLLHLVLHYSVDPHYSLLLSKLPWLSPWPLISPPSSFSPPVGVSMSR